jgi:hypothetical protein
MLFDARAKVPKRSGRPVIKNAKERIELLVEDLSKKKAKVIIPTPALAEFCLLASDAYEQYVKEIKRRPAFEIAGFDDIACIELIDLSLAHGKPKKSRPEDTWAKLKYDRQIVAISKAGRATIYSTDDGVKSFALQVGLEPIDLEDLQEPPLKQEILKLVKSAPDDTARILQGSESNDSQVDSTIELDANSRLSLPAPPTEEL